MILDDLLCRNVCYLCGTPLWGDRALCPDCSRSLFFRPVETDICPHCSFPYNPDEKECAFCRLLPSGPDSFHSLFYFRGIYRELLYAYKSGEMKNLRFFYAETLHKLFGQMGFQEPPVIVPVPPRKGKIYRQGWDQIRLLAKTLSSLYGCRILDVLERNDRIQQKTLTAEERAVHLDSSIRPEKNGVKKLKNQTRVILLDDVFTTGATLQSCTAVLKAMQPVLIDAVVLCSVL